MTVCESVESLPTADVDKFVGQLVGGGQLKEPITVTDIRRWVQAMGYPNNRYIDEDSAAKSRYGRIVAPQSFALACDAGSGIPAALVGNIPGTHTVFAGDEWWFYGPAIYPGDTVRVRRRFQGYTTAETKFAGPTVFSSGDTLYLNQRKDPVAKQRCTMARYRPELARSKGYFDKVATAPTFTTDRLRRIARQKAEWAASGEGGDGPGQVTVGDALPTRPIGPHTQASMVTEWSAFPFCVWGSQYVDGDFAGLDAGWLPEMMTNDGDGSDLAMHTGMNSGPPSAHMNLDKAKLIGLPRRYGLGASMGAWIVDYITYWAGADSFVNHTKFSYRSPVFEGDLTLLNGEVTAERFEPLLGAHLVTVHVTMSNQDGLALAHGDADLQLSTF
jgi:hypothetical protein